MKKINLGAIKVIAIHEGMFKDYANSAQLECSETKSYSGANVANSATKGLYGVEDFDVTPSVFTSKRTAFIQVPKNVTVSEVATKLALHSSARIYKVLGLEPYLTSEQRYSIATLSDGKELAVKIANQQMVCEMTKDAAGNDVPDLTKPILREGHKQYRVCFFDATGKLGDENGVIDYRSAHATKLAAIKSETKVATA